MTTKRRSADIRENELRLALRRIERGRSKSGEKKVTISSVAREAGVSAALIHNHYPAIAEAIRDSQGRSSRTQRDVTQHKLQVEREKNRILRKEVEELHIKIARLASLNEVLIIENRFLISKQSDLGVLNLR